eukprot:gnl/Ergobibamus_cyprinoides/56.p1 GENE.gnl/Ergobibamus_cyprinoides/56~~gnl/Ergobibamus_cyprinoides/56.p1  ORF type:complete len:327 (+),score=88.02 gnl/Ergobibamus_cyprinoides/56:187-1167(+)
MAHYADVSPEQLTGIGLQQLYGLGRYLAATYPALFAENYRDEDFAFVADSSPRCLQSALACGAGIWAGNGVSNFPALTLVPVETQAQSDDNTLSACKAKCKKPCDAAETLWEDDAGREYLSAQASFLHRIESACGSRFVDFTDIHGTFKDGKTIADGIGFDVLEGLTLMPGVSEADLAQLKEFVYYYVSGAILGTPEQVNMFVGKWPKTFYSALTEDAQAMQGWFAHREFSYAVASFFGFDFDVEPAEPEAGPVPPASTVIFELREDANGAQYVEASLWYADSTSDEGYAVEKLAFAGCSHKCPIAELGAIIDKRFSDFGYYKDLC